MLFPLGFDRTGLGLERAHADEPWRRVALETLEQLKTRCGNPKRYISCHCGPWGQNVSRSTIKSIEAHAEFPFGDSASGIVQEMAVRLTDVLAQAVYLQHVVEHPELRERAHALVMMLRQARDSVANAAHELEGRCW